MTVSEILSLTEADRAHRREFMEYCVTAAEERYQRLLRVLYEHFEQWNQDFFGGQLFPPHFLILAPKSPSAEGDYTPYSGWGSKSQLRLRPSLFDASHPHLVNGSRDPEGLQRYWLDVALHEVVHQYCNEILGKGERAEKGHGNTFARECTRIGELLRLLPVGPARKSRNKENLPSCAFWPTCVRPADYYLGAYRPDLAPKRSKRASGASAGAPDTDGESDEEGIDTPAQSERSKVLQPAEWNTLLAAVRELAIAGLVERLARHHGVPVIELSAPVTAAETLAVVPPPALVTEALAPVPPPLPAPSKTEDARDVEILARLPAGFTPSHYQMNLFRFILFGQGDGLVSAVAGSGKTTSLTLAAKLTQGDGLFLAFNKHIAEELGGRLKGTRMVARTIHGVGYATLMRRTGKVRIDEQKYRKLVQDAIRGTRIAFGEPQRKAIDALRELVNLSRLTLTDPNDQPALEEMIRHFGIEIDKEARADVLALLPKIIAEGERIAEQQKVIDYTDQLYLCYRWQLQPKQFNNIFVDECQDLNAAQLGLVLKSRAPGGRAVFVGDACQPEGTAVSVVRAEGNKWHHAQIDQVPIERLSIGDRVVSYIPSDSAFAQRGRVVQGITKRPYRGELIVVKTPVGHTSRYTPNHHCFANFVSLREKYAVYVMRKGDQFRIGKTQMDYKFIGGTGGNGPAFRMRAEKADAVWILDIYDTDAEARIMETAISGRFGIPQLTFTAFNQKNEVQAILDRAWSFIGNNVERGLACLQHFGRDISYPLVNASDQPYVSLKRPMVVRACNLLDGVQMLPYEECAHTRKDRWLPISLSREAYDDFVYSLDVEKEHLYVADGLVTHNCQAIMGFAGADADSFWNIQRRTNATLLPLSVCYRCPSSHLDLARSIVPEIEAAPGAITGEIDTIEEEQIGDRVQPGDMIICRLTAPLIKICIQLIQRRLSARVRGRDIGEQLSAIVKGVTEHPAYRWADFGHWLNTYADFRISKLAQREGSEGQVESLHDRVEAVRVCYESLDVRSADELIAEIE